MNREVEIKIDSLRLPGTINIPEDSDKLVIFSHGSGSSRLSPRNLFVAKVLEERKIATLLFDLLTPEEDLDYANRFNIDLISDRLIKATVWINQQAEAKNLKKGFFGASTGAAAALKAATKLPDIRTVVSRGGRPDLVLTDLSLLKIPVLLIVGELDYDVIELNKMALNELSNGQLIIIPSATHLFEEEGAMEKVADTAAVWFSENLK